MAERITEKSIGCFRYDLKDYKHKPKEFNDYDAFYAYNTAIKRLGELEDTLEAKPISSMFLVILHWYDSGRIQPCVIAETEQKAQEWIDKDNVRLGKSAEFKIMSIDIV